MTIGTLIPAALVTNVTALGRSVRAADRFVRRPAWGTTAPGRTVSAAAVRTHLLPNRC